jgi:valyl-tRNA synthetase
MPFLTEEIWQHLKDIGSPGARELSGWAGPLPDHVMIAPWPEAGSPDEDAENSLELVMDMVRAVRTTRSEYRVDPSKYISASIAAGSQGPMIRASCATIARLARLEPLEVYDVVPEKPKQAVALLVGDTTVYLPLSELTDIAAERERLAKELGDAERAKEGAERKLTDERFVTRAPAAVVERERERASVLVDRIRRLHERLELLEQ